MSELPIAEVFGFPIGNKSKNAERFRKNKLCPFHNKVPSCTKNSATNPLGVCSINFGNSKVITCPLRFTEDWIIASDAAKFIFDEKTVENGNWTTLRELRLNDSIGKTAGNIDYVLVSYDDNGKIIDFGSLEVQAVYISGNVTKPFNYYYRNRGTKLDNEWTAKDSPRPDYVSSSRKRLVPQLIFKGGILKHWGKKQTVALQKDFFNTLPPLPKAKCIEEAEIAWLIYDLKYNTTDKRYNLVQEDIFYTEFEPALDEILTPAPGIMEGFIEVLQNKLDEQLELISPEAPSLSDLKREG
jgi:hypothetical protein